MGAPDPMMLLVPRLEPLPPLPVAQFDVVALVDPLPELDRVPVPEQSVLLERVEDSSIEPETLGTEPSRVPQTGTDVPAPDPGDEGTWLAPPGIPAALGAT